MGKRKKIEDKPSIHTDEDLLRIQAKYLHDQCDEMDEFKQRIKKCQDDLATLGNVNRRLMKELRTLKERRKLDDEEMKRLRYANQTMAGEIFTLNKRLKMYEDLEVKRALIGAHDY